MTAEGELSQTGVGRALLKSYSRIIQLRAALDKVETLALYGTREQDRDDLAVQMGTIYATALDALEYDDQWH